MTQVDTGQRLQLTQYWLILATLLMQLWRKVDDHASKITPPYTPYTDGGTVNLDRIVFSDMSQEMCIFVTITYFSVERDFLDFYHTNLAHFFFSERAFNRSENHERLTEVEYTFFQFEASDTLSKKFFRL